MDLMAGSIFLNYFVCFSLLSFFYHSVSLSCFSFKFLSFSQPHFFCHTRLSLQILSLWILPPLNLSLTHTLILPDSTSISLFFSLSAFPQAASFSLLPPGLPLHFYVCVCVFVCHIGHRERGEAACLSAGSNDWHGVISYG